VSVATKVANKIDKVKLMGTMTKQHVQTTAQTQHSTKHAKQQDARNFGL